MAPFHFEDFSGGWNIRDAPSELQNNESPDLLNVTLDERGGIVKRLGCQEISAGHPFINAASNLFYWRTGDMFILQRGATLYKTTDFVTYTTIHTFTTSATVALCDFKPALTNMLVVVHPVDKVATYDGTTWSPVATSPKGNCSAVWQNKVWISGDPDNPSRVYASNAADPRVYNLAEDYIDMREKDHAPVTALGTGPGMDVIGRPGLLVFKKDWIGRINEPSHGATFGQYTTLHNEAGAAGPQAVTSSSAGLVCSISERGIWVCDDSSAQLASSKISRLFQADQLNFNLAFEWCAEQFEDRVIFCVGRQGSTRNDLMLEFHPAQGWIVPHDCAFSSMTVYTKNERSVYGSSVRSLDPPTDPYGRVLQVFNGWTDMGEDIESHFQTRWFEVQGGYSIRLRRMRVQGRGTFQVYTKHDYIDTVDAGQTFTGVSQGGHWGESNWGAFNWGQAASETFEDLYSWGVAKSFAVVVREKSSTAAYRSTLLGGTTAQETGSFAFYGVLLDYVRLGYS